MRVGILGGTFDPVHLGHLIVAEQARVRLDLDRVIFIPAGQPWLRAEQPATDGPDRLRMVELAVKSNPAFEASSQEVDRPGPTYTVDTLEVLKEEFSRELGPDTVLHCIIGMDALEQFHRWKNPERLVELCHLAVVNRPGHQPPELVLRAAIARKEVAVAEGGVGQIVPRVIAREHGRAANADEALLAGGERLAVPVEDLDLDPFQGTADRVVTRVDVVVEIDRDGSSLRRSEQLAHRDAIAIPKRGEGLAGERRPRGEAQAKRAQIRLHRKHGFGQAPIHDGHTRQESDALFLDRAQHRARVEALEKHQAGAGVGCSEQPVAEAVGVRQGNGAD